MLRDGVNTTTIANQIGVHQTTVAGWLRNNHDAYLARLYFITNHLVAHDPKNTAFWRQRRLEQLSLYRRANGLKLTRSPRKPRSPSDTRDSVSAEQQGKIICSEPSKPR